MALRTLKEVAKDIRSLKIQGARRVAKAAVEALVSEAKSSNAKTKKELYDELLKAAITLEGTRPTEPMMRNSLEQTLRFILAWTRTHPESKVEALKKEIESQHTLFLEKMEHASQKIAKYGSSELPKGANVLVHCHSTTVTKILSQAYNDGKNPKVTCLETRPLYQGRLTARELAEAGLDVSLYVDSAIGSIIQNQDLIFTGADAITAEGDLINKIGTYTIAQLAHYHSTRFLCAAELFKYDPLTRFGQAEPIEQRDKKEVWGSGMYAKEKLPGQKSQILIPKGLKINNPAFDRTPASLISAYITEEGLVSPAMLSIIAEEKLTGEKKW